MATIDIKTNDVIFCEGKNKPKVNIKKPPLPPKPPKKEKLRQIIRRSTGKRIS